MLVDTDDLRAELELLYRKTEEMLARKRMKVYGQCTWAH